MAEGLKTELTDDSIVYSFRFGASEKLIQLNQQQLHRIPFLSSLVVHNDSCTSAKNEDGEYVLHPPIRYNWFKAILSYVTTEHPSALFTELSQEADVLKMMDMYDYLCIDPLPVPLLKNQHLVRRNPVGIGDEEADIEYDRGTVLEARDTAVQFIIAVRNNEYDLDDSTTVQKIYNLVTIILNNGHVFGRRLCHHTFAVTKEYCFPFFSHRGQCYLNNALRSIEKNKKSFMITSEDDDHPLPTAFQNTFAWRGTYVPRIKNATDCFACPSPMLSHSTDVDDFIPSWIGFNSALGNSLFFRYWREAFGFNRYRYFLQNLIVIPEQTTSLDDYGPIKERKIVEAKSARSEHFNKLPKRPKVDKFKHRFNSKAQKYR